MKFGIPYDPFIEVVMNSCLDFDLGWIYPFNLLILSLIGFELKSPSWLLCFVRPEHTQRCVFWCF
ncbi:hypothetical protein Hanom_Chr15g01401201 [Helianthus anomalus]